MTDEVALRVAWNAGAEAMREAAAKEAERLNAMPYIKVYTKDRGIERVHLSGLGNNVTAECIRALRLPEPTP